MKYRDFVKILRDHGFEQVRTRATHRRYVARIKGIVYKVTVDYAQLGEDIRPRNLASMIHESGLPKSLFKRKR